MANHKDIAKRFWSKVDIRQPDECWPWTARRDINGYGRLHVGRNAGRCREQLAHRMAFEFSCGPIPKSLHVCHHCDNPPCCNPKHLFLGTNAENIRDCIRKGRFHKKPAGLIPITKLTPELVRMIRESTEANSALAARIGVARGTIWFVRKGKTWAHVA